MVFDCHVHLMGEGWLHQDFLVGVARMAAAPMGKATGDCPDPHELIKNVMPIIQDSTGEKLIPIMDGAGVDISCIFSLDYGLCTGEPEVPIEEQNRMIAEAAKRFPDRLVPFFTVDPRRDGAVEMFSRAVEDWGMKGLKLHPTAGFYPYDPACYPLYEKCVEYGVPVLFHTGSQPAPMKFRFTQPIYVDDVAADFPDLSIIMAHVAHSLWREALLVAEVKPNVYFDFSGWQITFNHYPEEFYRMLRRIIDDLGPWRVFFGSDGPLLNVLCPLENWVKGVREPDLSRCPEVTFTQEEIEIIMGKAFARLLGMPY